MEQTLTLLGVIMFTAHSTTFLFSEEREKKKKDFNI